MHVTEQGGQRQKNASSDQAKAPRAKSLSSILETVRQKMAYTIRGI